MCAVLDEEERVSRFWAQVDRRAGANGCWPWTGHVSARNGYGMTPSPGPSPTEGWRSSSTAHRVAYILTSGDPGTYVSSSGKPRARCIRHRCPDGPNRLCCNPRHLVAGTDLDNALDRAEDGNTYRGAAVSVSKLTESDVVSMRQLYRDGATVRALAERFGVHVQTVRPALLGRTWAHVPGRVATLERDRMKLRQDDVREIRRLRQAGWPLQRIADEFHVSVQTVCGITVGRTWKGVA